MLHRHLSRLHRHLSRLHRHLSRLHRHLSRRIRPRGGRRGETRRRRRLHRRAAGRLRRRAGRRRRRALGRTAAADRTGSRVPPGCTGPAARRTHRQPRHRRRGRGHGRRPTPCPRPYGDHRRAPPGTDRPGRPRRRLDGAARGGRRPAAGRCPPGTTGRCTMTWIRLLRTAAAPATGGLFLAVLAGTGAAGAAVGLMATSAWLISRAALHPPVLHLMVAIVAVRAFGIGRGVLRYAERLAGHDAALRALGRTRKKIFTHLAEVAPAGLADFRRADLAQRLADDVDAVLDLLTRVVLPYAVALIVGTGSVLLVGAMSLPA